MVRTRPLLGDGTALWELFGTNCLGIWNIGRSSGLGAPASLRRKMATPDLQGILCLCHRWVVNGGDSATFEARPRVSVRILAARRILLTNRTQYSCVNVGVLDPKHDHRTARCPWTGCINARKSCSECAVMTPKTKTPSVAEGVFVFGLFVRERIVFVGWRGGGT